MLLLIDHLFAINISYHFLSTFYLLLWSRFQVDNLGTLQRKFFPNIVKLEYNTVRNCSADFSWFTRTICKRIVGQCGIELLLSAKCWERVRKLVSLVLIIQTSKLPQAMIVSKK